MTMQELLPPGVYPIWSPFDSVEAAAALMQALAENEVGQMPDIKMPVLEAQTPAVQGTDDVDLLPCISSPG